jgi:hypothetical protein
VLFGSVRCGNHHPTVATYPTAKIELGWVGGPPHSGGLEMPLYPQIADPVTADVVLGWFRSAATSRHPEVPSAADVQSLVETINDLRLPYEKRELRVLDSHAVRFEGWNELDYLPDRSDFREVCDARPVLLELRKRLPGLVTIYERHETDPLVERILKQLLDTTDALFRNAPYLFELPKPGGQDKKWHHYAHILCEGVKAAWYKEHGCRTSPTDPW